MNAHSQSVVFSKAAVVSTAMIFGLTYSLSAALIALDLDEMGFSEAIIGANAAMHAVGVLCMAFLLPRLSALLGMRTLVILALVSAALFLNIFPAIPLIWLWFPMRILLGAASETLFVVSETWLNTLSTDENRSKSMGVYTAALSLGFALGPLILSIVGTSGYWPYLVGSALAIVAALLIASPRVTAPPITDKPHGSPLHYIVLAPVALAATVLNAAIESSGLSFLPLYAVDLGWSENHATQLMSVMMFGAIVLQIPIGFLGDRINRQKLLIILAALSAAGAAIWPWALALPWLTYTLLFLWGGAFVGIYTIMLSVVGSQFKGAQLVGIYASMGLMWGVGALLGPLFAGIAQQYLTHGLPVFVTAACLMFFILALTMARKPIAGDK
ncbi:MFS transporter [Ochrobactrum sp. Marseille-Q0166]|uniref:MFS transporter n=1 Tax=Ochrobactrum sp. Marseille-Q0166 TaxID=2761105 RepID=UPI0016560B03|nr:MFS transporter [Ochrobactrum sp. Marseille-Q0166]MBC8718726.1 MFS transporter [Ochrobactrum sp. Marseille-Q0166]